MAIQLLSAKPLVLIVDHIDTDKIETLDVGGAYTEYLHQQLGNFEEKPLGEFVDIVSTNINPNSNKYREQIFQYIDLREVDDIYGNILTFKIRIGNEVGSNKHRFQKLDILFAKIMPSLANKKLHW